MSQRGLERCRWILLSWLWVGGGSALAGPVNDPGGYPVAVMNSVGEFLIAGDQKILVYWRGHAAEERVAAAGLRLADSVDAAFSGGIAEPGVAAGKPVAIVCASKRAALFFPQRDPAHPSGRWEELFSLAGETLSSSRLHCAMGADGRYGIYLPDRDRVALSSGVSLAVPSMGDGAQIVAVPEHFVLLGARQKAVWLRGGPSGTLALAPIPNPFGTTDQWTRFAGNGQAILKADSFGVSLCRWALDPAKGEIRMEKPERLPVSPCESTQVCGVSLAGDDSWMVSGYWSTYVGKASRWNRLPIPNFSRESGGVAVAHQGLTGRFVYVGNDDGDLGNLAAIGLALDRESLTSPGLAQAPRWTIWLKPEGRARASFGTSPGGIRILGKLFPWSPGRQETRALRGGGRGSAAEALAVVAQGALPDPVPADWVAWEPELVWQARPLLPSTPGTEAAGATAGDLVNPWWVSFIHRDEALELAARQGVSPAPVVVSVVDSGAQLDHPWLSNAWVVEPGEIPGNGLDDDDNGFVDDVHGYDFVNEDPYPQDLLGHGTHVAGLLGARDPATGKAVGMNAHVRVRLVRALDASGKSNSIDLARALGYAVDQGSDLINCSWGGGASTQALRDAFSYVHSRQVPVISSAGNDKLDTDVSPEVPKMYPGVISVGALNQAGALGDSSNFGARSVRWLTPGQDIPSTVPGNGFQWMTGTSMAAPIAANIASWVLGLLRALHPGWSQEALQARTQEILCASASAAGVAGKSVCGKLDALEATRLTLSSP